MKNNKQKLFNNYNEKIEFIVCWVVISGGITGWFLLPLLMPGLELAEFFGFFFGAMMPVQIVLIIISIIND